MQEYHNLQWGNFFSNFFVFGFYQWKISLWVICQVWSVTVRGDHDSQDQPWQSTHVSQRWQDLDLNISHDTYMIFF